MVFFGKIVSKCTSKDFQFSKTAYFMFPTGIYRGSLAGLPDVILEIFKSSADGLELSIDGPQINTSEDAQILLDEICVLLTNIHFKKDIYNNHLATTYFEQDFDYFLRRNTPKNHGWVTGTMQCGFELSMKQLESKIEPIYQLTFDALKQNDPDASFLLMFFILERLEKSTAYLQFVSKLPRSFSLESLRLLRMEADKLGIDFKNFESNLSKQTIDARHTKLFNFLSSLGISELKVNDKCFTLTKDVVREIICLRNDMAHGSSESKSRVGDCYRLQLIPLIQALLNMPPEKQILLDTLFKKVPSAA